MESKHFCIVLFITFLIVSCKPKDNGTVDDNPTPYSFQTPKGFPTPNLPSDIPLTNEGIEVGRHVFYNKKMSIDQSISCGDCHAPKLAFSDDVAFSKGVDERLGPRNAMPLFNLAWYKFYMWDGKANNLHDQIMLPLTAHVEMAVPPSEFPTIEKRFQNDNEFVQLYKKAFKTEQVTMENLFRALVQFELTLVSANSKYDQYIQGKTSLTENELEGMRIFERIDDTLGTGECAHCHSIGGNFSDPQQVFRNNGLDGSPIDLGRGKVSMNFLDNYKFKVPSLRNLVFTGPYMHDGRFTTIDEVIDHYNVGVDTTSPNIDPNFLKMKMPMNRLSNKEKGQLKAFLLTLTDSSFITNPQFQSPY